jgi:signal transduction histidine kinase
MKNYRVYLRRFVDYLFHRHWWILGFILILLTSLELFEYLRQLSDTFHVMEVIFYVFLLGITGILVEELSRLTRSQEQTMKILDYKHRLSLDLMVFDNWDNLVEQVTKSVAKIAGANSAQLFLWTPITERYEHVSVWDNEFPPINEELLGIDHCQECMARMDFSKSRPESCKILNPELAIKGFQEYCLPINYRNAPFALMKFARESNHKLGKDQQLILSNISDEIAVALEVARELKQAAELRITEATLAERHTVSQYLHDNLSQNLGYLRMKLDQYNNDASLLTSKNFLTDIAHMKLAVDESYRIVRGKLESTHPDALPMLNNYLQEYANNISQRANIEIEFLSKGVQKELPVEIQRAVFYVFQEVLSNVEKHAKASKVDIILQWAKDKLALTIKDNGIGFNPNLVDNSKHFGLGIVQERLAAINGIIEISSSANSGTSVRIGVPLSIKSQG